MILTGNNHWKVPRLYFIALAQEEPETIEVVASDSEEPKDKRVVVVVEGPRTVTLQGSCEQPESASVG